MVNRKGSFLNRPQTSNFLNSNENKNFFLTTSNHINDITNNNNNNNNMIITNTSNSNNSDSGKNSSNPDSPPSFRPKSAFIKSRQHRITASISSNEHQNDSDSLKEVDADSVHDSETSQHNEQDHDLIDLDAHEKENFYSLNNNNNTNNNNNNINPKRSLSSPVQQLQLITDNHLLNRMTPTYAMPNLTNRASMATLQRAASSTSTQAASRFKAAYDQKTQKLRSKSPYSPSKSSIHPIPIDSYRAKSSCYGGESSTSSIESHRSIGRHSYTTAEFNKFKNKLIKNHPRIGYFSSFASNNFKNSIIDVSNDKVLNAGLTVVNSSNTNNSSPSPNQNPAKKQQLSTSQIKKNLRLGPASNSCKQYQLEQ